MVKKSPERAATDVLEHHEETLEQHERQYDARHQHAVFEHLPGKGEVAPVSRQ